MSISLLYILCRLLIFLNLFPPLRGVLLTMSVLLIMACYPNSGNFSINRSTLSANSTNRAWLKCISLSCMNSTELRTIFNRKINFRSPKITICWYIRPSIQLKLLLWRLLYRRKHKSICLSLDTAEEIIIIACQSNLFEPSRIIAMKSFARTFGAGRQTDGIHWERKPIKWLDIGNA